MTGKATVRRYNGKIEQTQFDNIIEQVSKNRTLSKKARAINKAYFVDGDIQVDIAQKQDCSGAYVNKVCSKFLGEYLDFLKKGDDGQEE